MEIMRLISIAQLFCALAMLAFAPASYGDAPASESDGKPQEKVTGNRLHLTQQPFKISGPLMPALFKPIDDAAYEKFLNKRIPGGLGNSFAQFANMYVVSSQLHSEYLIGLFTNSDEIAKTELTPAFPDDYKPTVREFLDQIALETSTKWSNEKTGKFILTDKKMDKPMEKCLCIEFSPTKRDKTFEIALAKGWRVIEHGCWTQCIPPSFPVGMDVYEMGKYSCDANESESELKRKIPKAVVLDWAHRVKPDAAEKDLFAGKVGNYDAVCFDTMIKSKMGGEIRWRQWGFMVGNQAYMVLSTIFPEKESTIFPDVQSMLASFRVK